MYNPEMRTVGLFDAKQRLSQLVKRAGAGEEIGITRHGRLAARLVPPAPARGWEEIFAALDEVRRGARWRGSGPRHRQIKELIATGRS